MEVLSQTAPQDNGRCKGGVDEGATSAKRMKLASVLQQTAADNNGTKHGGATNGLKATTDKRKSAVIGQTERVKAAENGHHAVAVVDEDALSPIKRNQDGEISDGHVTTEDWKAKWERGKTRFHKTQVHGMLKKHITRLTEGKSGLRFLMPLCGKSVDMVWLLEKGYSVVGCDVVEIGVQQFFTENEIEYTTETLGDLQGKVYKGIDKDITIYVADFFTLTSAVIGHFDCVWDRGSLAAINPDERERYRDVIIDVLKPGSHCLLDIFEVPHDVFSGPPHSLTTGELEHLYGASCSIELLEHVDAMNPWSKTWGVTYFYENDFLLTPKM